MLSRLTNNILNIKLNKSFSTYYKIVSKDKLCVLSGISRSPKYKIHEVEKRDLNHIYVLSSADQVCINEVANKDNLERNTICNSKANLLEHTNKYFVYTTKDQLFKHPNITGDTLVEVMPVDQDQVSKKKYNYYETTTDKTQMKYNISKRIFISDPKPLFSLDTLRELNLENEVNENYAYAAIYNNSLEGITIAKNYIKYIDLFSRDNTNNEVYLRFENLTLETFRLILKYYVEYGDPFRENEFISLIQLHRFDLIYELYEMNQITETFQDIISDYVKSEKCPFFEKPFFENLLDQIKNN
jgi:hypothetical protein